jgi:hypothetical protein
LSVVCCAVLRLSSVLCCSASQQCYVLFCFSVVCCVHGRFLLAAGGSNAHSPPSPRRRTTRRARWRTWRSRASTPRCSTSCQVPRPTARAPLAPRRPARIERTTRFRSRSLGRRHR